MAERMGRKGSAGWLATMLATAIALAASPQAWAQDKAASEPTTSSQPGKASLDWPQLQRDAGHSGRTSASVGPAVKCKWVWVDEQNVTRNFESRKDSRIAYPKERTVVIAGDVQPIVAEGKVFFGADNGQFFALNASNASTAWKAQLGGAILHTAAYADGKVVVPCMDRKLYCFSAIDGRKLWEMPTGAGILAAPLIVDKVAYVGSRDGVFYAASLSDGRVLWKYTALAKDAEDPFTGAPIVQPAASDGTHIFFGAENLYFYCLDAKTGKEVWRKKLRGQSLLYTWPVVVGKVVMIPVMTSAGDVAYLCEAELKALPGLDDKKSTDMVKRNALAKDIWPKERDIFLKWLKENPHQQSMFVLDAATGEEAYTMPLGRVGGLNNPPRAPVLYSDGRPILYWRTKSSTVMTGGTFASDFTPDLSAMNVQTGDREAFTPDKATGMNCEMDNNWTLTVGGDWVYLNNHMRGVMSVNPKTGDKGRITSIMANWDGGDFRGWGNQIIYWGNDSNKTDALPPSTHRSPQGDSGVTIVEVDGKPTMIFSESGHYQIDFGAIVALESK